MSIAIIVGAHGSAAEQLLKTADMILGEQSNAAYIDFFPGENTETLIKKYTKCLSNLDTTTGVLFIVDTWGGSPFNAASRIVINKSNYEVVTGVNIPMLTETFMARADNISLQELVHIAVKTGRIGIKSLKSSQSVIESQNVKNSSTKITEPRQIDINNSKKMIIALARIDDRLIHGQVSTCWTKETNVKRIVVVSDEVAADKVRSTLLTQVAPPGVTAHVVDVEKAVRVYNNPKYSKDRVMLLFTNPMDALRLVEFGVKIKSINIGGMAFKKGKIQVNNAVSIDDKDIIAFKTLNEHGIELEVRKVFSDSPLKMMELINKLNKHPLSK